MPRAPLSTRDVHARYPRQSGLQADARGLGWAAVLILSTVAWTQGWIPYAWLSTALWGTVGLCAFIRNFHAAHEGFHADHETNPLRPLRALILLPTSPLCLGYDALYQNHRHHHARPAGEDDPDHFLITGGPARGLMASLLQPEWATLLWIRRHGVGAQLGVTLTINVLFYAALSLSLGPWGLLWWVVITRIGNAASWFIFDWILHHPKLWGVYTRLPVPRPLRVPWMVLFTRSNLLAVEYHTVHHTYDAVRSKDLPALARELEAA